MTGENEQPFTQSNTGSLQSDGGQLGSSYKVDDQSQTSYQGSGQLFSSCDTTGRSSANGEPSTATWSQAKTNSQSQVSCSPSDFSTQSEIVFESDSMIQSQTGCQFDADYISQDSHQSPVTSQFYSDQSLFSVQSKSSGYESQGSIQFQLSHQSPASLQQLDFQFEPNLRGQTQTHLVDQSQYSPVSDQEFQSIQESAGSLQAPVQSREAKELPSNEQSLEEDHSLTDDMEEDLRWRDIAEWIQKDSSGSQVRCRH